MLAFLFSYDNLINYIFLPLSQTKNIRMSDWGGFSDAELRQLRSGGDAKSPTSGKPKSTASKSSKKALAATKTSKPKPAKKLPEEALFPTSTKTSSKAAKNESKEEIQVNKIDTSSKEDEVVCSFIS
jgi:hypothetical protein